MGRRASTEATLRGHIIDEFLPMRVQLLPLTAIAWIPAVAQPDAITHHQVAIAGKTLAYTARAGLIPIRDNETGDVHGNMFFIA